MFRQASVVLPQTQAAIEGQMVLPTGGFARHPVDDIMDPMPCQLVVPYGKT